jgi:CMP-N-acetylneuraminic acid synthetase
MACIPIKTNNERAPGKNTRRFFDNTPLMFFIQKSLLEVKDINEIFVFCSDERIRNYCMNGVKFLKRSSELDSARSTPADIITAFMTEIEADIYITAHATTPFVSADAIADCLNAVVSEEYDSAFTAVRIKKLLWNEQRHAYNFDPANVPRTQDLSSLFAEVGAAYVFRKEVFLNTGRRIGTNPFIREVSEIEAIDIDYPEDFEVANAIYKEILKNNNDTTA